MAHDEDFIAQLEYQARVDALNRRNTLASIISTVTGEAPTAEQMAKYNNMVDNPAAIQAELSREVALRPAKGTFANDINATLMSKLGREATASELNYFGKQMEQGNLDAYGLESFVKGTEEFQTNYTKKAREELKTELGETDQAYLDKVNSALQAKYNTQGRSGAGAFGASLITAGKDLASERGSYLANIGYQNAQQGSDILKSQYQQNLNQMYQNQGYGQGLAQEARNRYYSTADYNRNQGGQQQLMALQQQYARANQPTFMQGLLPGLIQAGATIGGAAIAGPVGAGVANRLSGQIYNYNSRLNL
jgi:hypothetical protein